jgi:long-chain fatty acid transport protein
MTNTVPFCARLFFYSVAASAIAAAAAPRAHAAAFYLQDQSVRGLGRAYSGEVSDTGAASLWWNPASIADSANELYVGANTILTDATVRDTGSTLNGPFGPRPVGGSGTQDDPVLFGVVPNSAASFRINDRFAVGLSFSAPFNFTSQYDGDSFARYNSLKARLTTLDAQLTGAMKVTDWLDLGVALNTEYTSANLAQAYPGVVPGEPDGNLDLKGSSYDFGYTVGARVHGERWSVGASYKSAVDHDLDGRIELNGPPSVSALVSSRADGTADFTTPWIATIGARYRILPKLTLDVQAERFGWSEFNAIDVKAGPALSQSIVEGYRDTTSGAVGLDYDVTPRWVMRAGVGYDQSPIQLQYRNTFVPDSDRMLYTLGTSYRFTPRLTMDAAGAYVAFRGTNLDYTAVDYAGTALATTINERGTVVGNAKILSLGVRYAY